jgi:hypothetical protein
MAVTASFLVLESTIAAQRYPKLDPSAEDNQLPQRYERIRIGMSEEEVLAQLGHPPVPIRFLTRRYADRQFILHIVMSPDDKVVGKVLFRQPNEQPGPQMMKSEGVVR